MLYHTLGEVPRKRHTVFRQPGGELYSEHLMGSLGFSGPASLLYHIHKPTSVLATKELRPAALEADEDPALRMRHFHLHDVFPAESVTLERTPVLFNSHTVLSFVTCERSDEHFYRNAQADEIVYVSHG